MASAPGTPTPGFAVGEPQEMPQGPEGGPGLQLEEQEQEQDQDIEEAALAERMRRRHDMLRQQIEIEELEGRLIDLRRRRGPGFTPAASTVGDYERDDASSSTSGTRVVRSGPSSKPRLREPETFQGKTLKEARDFVRSLELVFALAPDAYRSDREKVLYGVMFLAGEPRENWHHDHSVAELEDYTWMDFKSFVLDAVEDPANRTLSVTVSYEEAKQKEHQTVAAFATELATLEDQMEPYTPEQRTRHLLAKLRPSLRLTIVTHHDPPQRREDLISLATRLKTAGRAGNVGVPVAFHKRVASKYQEKSQPKKSRGGSPRSRGGDTHARRERDEGGQQNGLSDSGADKGNRYAHLSCYTCGEQGHITTHCPSKASNRKVGAIGKRAKGKSTPAGRPE